MKKLNLFIFYFFCTFTFFHCYFFSNFYLHRGARQSCLLLTPLLLDEGLPEWWPSWSQFSINFLLFGKIFIVLPTFSYSTEIVFNLNFTLSNQMSIFLWWQCPIAPPPKKIVCLICQMIIKSLTLDIMFLPSYRWKENSDIRRSMNLQTSVNGITFHSRLRIEKKNCKLFGSSLLKTTSRVAIFVQRRRPETDAHCVWENHHHTSCHWGLSRDAHLRQSCYWWQMTNTLHIL